MPPSDSYRLMQIFHEVVRAKSFAIAAARLGMKPPAVSKSIAKLEREFGARLINRSTQSMSLTDAGEVFHHECQRIVQDIEELQEIIASDARDPAGTLRITATPAFGQRVLSPLIARFISDQPRIRIELSLTDRLVDLNAERVDIAIRSASNLGDSALYRLQLSSQERVIVGSPDYIEAHGYPDTPEELVDHACLAFRANRLFRQWRFCRLGKVRQVAIDPVLVADSYSAIHEATRCGAGIANLFYYQVANDLEHGRLLRLLPAYEMPKQNIFALYTQKRENSQKINLFLRHLQDSIPYVDTTSAIDV